MRICILGTPRSGSQYLANVIEKSFRSAGIEMCNLSEPFTITSRPGGGMLPVLSSSGKIYNEFGLNLFFDKQPQSEYVLSILKKADPAQPLVLKYFMDLDNDLEHILTQLRACGFKIIILKRSNIEHHLISWGAGQLTGVWDSTFPNYVPDLKMNFTDDILTSMESFYKHHLLRFDSINIDAPVVYYENLATDIQRLINVPVDTDIKLKKQLNIDPYTQIRNSEKVREFIKELIK